MCDHEALLEITTHDFIQLNSDHKQTHYERLINKLPN